MFIVLSLLVMLALCLRMADPKPAEPVTVVLVTPSGHQLRAGPAEALLRIEKEGWLIASKEDQAILDAFEAEQGATDAAERKALAKAKRDEAKRAAAAGKSKSEGDSEGSSEGGDDGRG